MAPSHRLTRRTALAAALAAPAIVRAQPRLQRIDLLLDWKPMPTYAGFYYARERGLFAKRGLEVAIQEGSGANVSAELVAESAEYWIGVSAGIATAISRSHGLGVKSLSVLYHNTPSAIFSRAEAPIRKPTDLYGKRMGLVPGSVTADEYHGFVVAQQLDRRRITEVVVDWTSAPLYDGRVDALIDYTEMLPAELQATGKDIELMRLADYGVKVYSLNMVVKEQAWQQADRRATALRLLEAVLEAYGQMQRAPSEVMAVFRQLFPSFDRRYVSQATSEIVRHLGPPPLGRQTREGWQATLDHLDKLGLLHRPMAVADVAIFS
jgi:NitT/TauT family transport system substrate-binding protein